MECLFSHNSVIPCNCVIFNNLTCGFSNSDYDSPVRPPATRNPAFTLIELLAVVAIIAILVGLLFPAFKAVQNQARQTQAKNDLTQIVNAVNAFYTEYGKYPISGTVDTTFGLGGSPTNNENLFRELRA